jgi:small-conductance mechanosensitive channel
MISSEYFSQLGSGLWFAVKQGINKIEWTDSRFFAYQGWALFTQVFLSLMFGLLFYLKRKELDKLEHWRFLAGRPFAAGIFLVSMVTMITLSYYGVNALWRTANIIVALISFRLISETLIAVSWKRQFVFGLMIIIIINRILYVINFPLPLVRLVTLFEAMIGVAFCLRWSKESIENKEPAFYSKLMRFGAFFFVLIIITEILGVQALPLYLLISVMNSIATLLVFILFLHFMHGGMKWLIYNFPFSIADLLDKDEIDSIIARVTRFFDYAIWILIFLPAILKVWGVFNNLEDAINWLLSIGFQAGGQRITLGLLLVSAGILYLSFLFSWIIQKLLMHVVLVKKVAEQGIRYSISRLIHYLIVFIGFLIAISVLGLDVTKLTIMISALGVGIGFGMQGIVNNFISGLILLYERPVRVGDTIEIDGKWSEIKRIGLRATTVQTYEQADMIIPNADLIASNVINWTLTNRLIRVSIPVGVAYGSDVALVMETLKACADSNSKVAQRTPSQVLFRSFGESSLNFELRAWVIDSDYRLQVVSELNQEIDRRFREANIEISFPQRDLHLRSVDESIKLGRSPVAPNIKNRDTGEQPTINDDPTIVA